MKIIFVSTFILFSTFIYCQNSNRQNIVDFINIYQVDESWAAKTVGKFEYNSYSEILSFNQNIKVNDAEKSVFEVSYILDIENVESIVEVVGLQNNIHILFFRLNLKEPIYYKNYKKSNKSTSIPDYTNEKRKRIDIDFAKSLTVNDVEKLRKAIRDLFNNVKFETEIIRLD